MRALVVVVVSLVVLGFGRAHVAQGQGSPPVWPLPPAEALGDDWKLSSAHEFEKAPPEVFETADAAVYSGPNGSRVLITAFRVADSRAAIRQSWAFSEDLFHAFVVNSDYESGSESRLAETQAPSGCADVRRGEATDGMFGSDFPTALTICAADPDFLLAVVTSGEVMELTGYRASDAVTETVLSQIADGPPSATPAAG